MTLVIIIGPQAVGKMTVGQALEAVTDLKLFHNHMSIDLVSHFFSYGAPEGRALVARIRSEIFHAVANSDLPGMIFTYVWAFDLPEERAYIEGLADIFSAQGHRICWVELDAPFDERLRRNRSANRLAHKPSKRDLETSEALLKRDEGTYRLNSDPGELEFETYLRLDVASLSPDAAASAIVAEFDL